MQNLKISHGYYTFDSKSASITSKCLEFLRKSLESTMYPDNPCGTFLLQDRTNLLLQSFSERGP